MSKVVFYGKPDCRTNARQRRRLGDAGHQVVARDLLAEPWTPERLAGFFGGLPVGDWFNPSAPAVRDGDIVPRSLVPEHALRLLVSEPLLIRRPLMEVGGETMVGFDPHRVHAWIGLGELPADADLESCSRDSADPGDRIEPRP